MLLVQSMIRKSPPYLMLGTTGLGSAPPSLNKIKTQSTHNKTPNILTTNMMDLKENFSFNRSKKF